MDIGSLLQNFTSTPNFMFGDRHWHIYNIGGFTEGALFCVALHADLFAVSEMLFDKLNKGFALKNTYPAKRAFACWKQPIFQGCPPQHKR
jgi:hypothetical protein